MLAVSTISQTAFFSVSRPNCWAGATQMTQSYPEWVQHFVARRKIPRSGFRTFTD